MNLRFEGEGPGDGPFAFLCPQSRMKELKGEVVQSSQDEPPIHEVR